MRLALIALPAVAVLLLSGCEQAKRLTGMDDGTPVAEEAATDATTDAASGEAPGEAPADASESEAETGGDTADDGALSALAPTVEAAQRGETGEEEEEDPGKPLAVAEDAEGCGAAARQDLLGKTTSDLTGYRYPVGTRFIGPGTAVTRDLRPGRLNIEYNRLGIVTRVWCG